MRVSFGFSNAPADFQRYMENCLTNVRDEFTFPFLDDVLVYSDHFGSHVDHSRKVFQILRENGIKVKANKGKLFQKQIICLGRTVTEKEYGIDTSSNRSCHQCTIKFCSTKKGTWTI